MPREGLVKGESVMKMKKIAVVAACGLLAAALGLFGCSSGGGESADQPADSSAQESAQAPAGQPAGEDIKPVEGTIEKPAQMGEWLTTTIYSSEDSENHPIYYRITGVDFDQAKAEDAIKAYNEASSIIELQGLDEDDAKTMEYMTVSYELYIPEAVPGGEYGLTPPTIRLAVYGTDGSSLEVDGITYIGLYSTDVTLDEPDWLQPGDSMTGTSLLAIPKNAKEFLIQSSYSDPETEESVETNTLAKR